MKKLLLFLLILSTLIIASCTINIPYDYEITGKNYKIVFKVEPEDALLLLNGRLLGEVYEFSTWNSALNLASKNNELVIKRDGYIEELINLYDYSGKEIVIETQLKRDRAYKRKKYIIKKKELNNDKEESNGVGVKPKKIKEIEQESANITHTIISLKISPKESTIYINNKFWGIVPESGIIDNMVLKKGKYTIEILKPGYKNYSKTIIVQGKNDKLNMKITLKKKK